MIFAELPLGDCVGAILAHSRRAGADMFRKGRVLSGADIAALAAAGATHLTVARLEAGDVGEDEAASELAAVLLGQSPHLVADCAATGRVNLHATGAGVLKLDPDAIHALNRVDEAITLATLPAFAAVQPRQMVATIKIIPYAVPRAILDRAKATAPGAIRLHPYRPHRVAVIQSELPGLKASVLDKTERVMAERLAAMAQVAPAHRRCPHRTDTLRAEIERARDDGAGMILVVGASAISDRRDVVPAAIRAAGGTIEHFGMPVDPGNLLLMARIGDMPVLGLPGCVRSPKQNGCDWVMQRLLAGLRVTAADISGLGIGGLLAEIPSRPQPREARAHALRPKIAAIVLAAGKSSRMGANKLLLDLDGRPIVDHVVAKARAAGIGEIVVVTGHQADRVKGAIAGDEVRIVETQNYAAGMAESLKAGLRALSPETDAALILLGDMPQVSDGLLTALMRAYDPLEGAAIVLPVAAGKRGNPALFDRRFFAEMLALEGDVGARHIIAANAELVAEVPAEAREIFTDVDTPEAYAEILSAWRNADAMP